MPAYHFYGADAFRRREAYDSLRAANDTDGGLTANTITFAAAALSPAELQAAAMTVPFLAEHRLVRVDGLCAPFNAPRNPARAPAAGAPPRAGRGCPPSSPRCPPVRSSSSSTATSTGATTCAT